MTLRHHVLSRLSDRARAKQTKSTTTRPQPPPRRKKEGQRSEHSTRPEQRPKARDGRRRAPRVETENLGGAQKGAWEGGLFFVLDMACTRIIIKIMRIDVLLYICL